MEAFLKNCGVSSLEVGVGGEGSGEAPQRRCLDQPYLLIGSDARNDVRLDDPGVSRRHAYVQAVGGRVLVVDLGSRTGVHWPTGPRAFDWLDWDQPLALGNTTVRVSPPRPAAGNAALIPRRTQAPRPEPPVVIEVSGGAPGLARWSMNRPVALVGRAAACKVHLQGAGVSGFHCGLVRGPLGVWVVDLLSRDGTRVNGEKVAWARLEDGARLQVGPFVLRVWYEAPGEPSAARPSLAVRRAAPPPGPVAALPDQSLLLPIVNEFNRMQQQMLDQFHQTMLMMAEMFSTLHREQAELVREELDEMRRLTRELYTLQAERARQTSMTPVPVAVSVAATAGLNDQPPTVKELLAADGDAIAAALCGTTGAGKGAPQPLPATTATGTPQNGAAAPEQGSQTQGSAAASPEVHDWLSRRIEKLQEERNGRWQKILQFMMGGKNP